MRRSLGIVTAVIAALLVLAAPAQARTLRLGDRGTDVRNLNKALISLGYLPAGQASSRFGDATHHGVMALQKYEGLDRDGIVGPQTKAELRTAVRPVPQTAGGSGRRIEVLLDRQVALLIRRGVVERTIAVSTGAAGYRTPPGSFRIFRKERQSWSVPYSVWLPYASYFNNGIAFHGYPEVPPYAASHGCVRVPEPFAPELYAFAKMDTRVKVLSSGAEAERGEEPLGPYGP